MDAQAGRADADRWRRAASPKDKAAHLAMTAALIEPVGMFLASGATTDRRGGPKMSNVDFGPARSRRSSAPRFLKKRRRRS